VRIAAVDTETTSLRPDRQAWDVAVIVRDEDGSTHENQWFVDADSLDLVNADLAALNIGRFYERHPAWSHKDNALNGTWSELFVLQQVEHWTQGATLIGSFPSFDAETLGNRMRAHGILPSWYYRTVDVVPLITGFLACSHALDPGVLIPELPWKSDDLSRRIGVEPPGPADRHTALGDARWVLQVWDTIMQDGEWLAVDDPACL